MDVLRQLDGVALCWLAVLACMAYAVYEAWFKPPRGRGHGGAPRGA
jgi:hypothetical protein